MSDSLGDAAEEGLLGLAFAASELLSSLAAPVLGRGDERSHNVFTRVADQIVPTVIGSVDVDALLERIDVNALLDRIDVDGLLDRIDIDRLLGRVDVQALLDRVDVGALMTRIDLDAVLAEVNLNAMLERIDVAAIAERAQIGELVAQSTRDVAGSTLDLARRQLVAIDLIVLRLVHRVVHRPDELESGPPSLVDPAPDPGAQPEPVGAKGRVTGRYAGAASRLAEFAFDAFAVVALFGFAANVAVFCARLILGAEVDTTSTDNHWWLAAYLVWILLYHWVSLAITGRTIGKWLVGVRVVERDGSPLRTGAAFVRVVTLPLSLVSFGLGLVGIVIGNERRALHDVLAGSVVVYDWGDRPAEMPAPLTRWLSRQGALEVPTAHPTGSPPPSALPQRDEVE